MDRFKLEHFFKGWVIGDFSPSLLKNSNFEIGVKNFEQGDTEPAHMQLIATELTIVVSGKIRLGDQYLSDGDIAVIPPNEVADFEALTTCSLVCIKYPSIPNDKIVI
jgi:quercetin dioxygenase-like cupin family protein